MKKVFLIVSILIIICHLSYSTEKSVSLQKNDFSFLQNSKSNLTNYAKGSGSNIKVKIFTGIAIAGTAVFGSSWIFIIPGIALMAYGWENRMVSASYWSYGSYVYERYEDLTTFYVGAGVLLFGLILLFTGLPMMIVGWIMRSYYKNKVSMFMDSNDKYSRLGLAIKF